MKRLYILPIMILVLMGTMCVNFIQGAWRVCWDTREIINAKCEWLPTPPADSDTFELTYIRLSLDQEDIHYKYYLYQRLTAAKSDAAIYLKALNDLNFYTDDQENFSGWIKGDIEGNKLVFKDSSLVYVSRFDAVTDVWDFESHKVIRDTIPVVDSVRMWGVEFGPLEKYEYNEVTALDYWDVSFTGHDVSAEYNPRTDLIRHPDSELFFTPYRDKTYKCSKMLYDNEYLYEWLDTPCYDLNEVGIKDFLIGRVMERDPGSLPAPEYRYTLRTLDSSMPYPTRADYWINMDIVTDDGWLLDYGRLWFDFYIDGICVKTRPYIEVADPFCKYGVRSAMWVEKDIPMIEDIPFVEVECWYETEDGGRITSGRVVGRDVSEVKEITVDTTGSESDGPIYDLTGRMVRGENLSPGIYIRNGRKFVVGR